MTRTHWLINPTWRCHNNCAYCWMQKSVGRRPDLLNAHERPMADWAAAIDRDKPEVVDIAGGEPLLTGWIAALLVECPYTMFGLSTNGLALRELKRLVTFHPNNLISVNVSYHPDTKAMMPDYDEHFKAAVLLLRDAHYNVHTNVVNYGDNALRSQPVREWLKAQGVKWELSPYEEVAGLGQTQEVGLCCKGGTKHLTIAPDGTAWPCLTSLRSPYYADLVLGNWLDNTIDPSKKPQPCYLACHDYFILAKQHTAGDMWGVEAKPCE